MRGRTYPSIYLVMEGTVSVSDLCGPLGKAYTNPTIAIAPGGLSSLTYNSVIPVPASGVETVPYDPGLPQSCRSYQFQEAAITTETYSQASNNMCVTRTNVVTGVSLGPNKPLLAPPKELLNLDPLWRSCVWNTRGALHAWTCK